MAARWLLRGLKFMLFIVVGTLFFGGIVMLLWNALIPQIFGAPSISFWQGAGLLLLSHILLRGWGRWHYSNGWKHDRWRRRFEERMAGMTPEEREKFRQEWKERCGWGGEGAGAAEGKA